MPDKATDRAFHPEQVALTYRRVIARLNEATTEVSKHELRTTAMQLRVEWKVALGEDSLHQTVFGEPERNGPDVHRG
jgi:hypothetical protein